MFTLSMYKISFKHDRADLLEQPKKITNESENGSTLCMISNLETGNLVSFGWHICQKQGCFNKNKQRKGAMAHALVSFEREERIQFWHEYFKKRGKVD